MVKSNRHSLRVALCLSILASLVVWTVPVSSHAAPPRWAPAHGWRQKHDPYYVGYHGRRWKSDYGILSGRCDRAAVGAAVGGALGGTVGASVGSGDTRVVATAVGAAIGAVIGGEIGRAMDAEDRGCIGHSLELAKTGQSVRWSDPGRGVNYTLTLTRDFNQAGRVCRSFTARVESGGTEQSFDGEACRTGDGSWDLL